MGIERIALFFTTKSSSWARIINTSAKNIHFNIRSVLANRELSDPKFRRGLIDLSSPSA